MDEPTVIGPIVDNFSRMTVLGASTPVGWVWLNGHGPDHCALDRVVECAVCDAEFADD